MMRTKMFGLFLTASLFATATRSQNFAATNVAAVHCKGLKRYTEAQLLPIINLPPRTPFDPVRIQEATQRLGATGAFDEVRYSYRPIKGGVEVEFQVKESVRFRRCTFDNFPFASEHEILTFIQGKVPLYDGSAPDGGNMLDEISAALEELAKSKGITATATHIPYTKLGNGNFEYLFQLAGPAIKVASVRFNGAKDLPEAELVREAQPLVGHTYSLANCREFAANSFVPYYQERGFLKVTIGDAAAKLSDQGTADEYRVAVEYPVSEGIGYRWDTVQWQGNAFLKTDKLKSLLALTTGEPANIKKIQSSWENISAEYGKHGYIQVNLKTSPVFDDPNRTVRFQVQIAEGEQFRMGTFSTEGFSSALAERLQTRWNLKSGEIFDASYLREFLKNELASALANGKGRRAKISSTLVPNQSAHTVDVVLLSE